MDFSDSSSSCTRIDQPSKLIVSPSLVPMPTVYTRTPRSAAMRAASRGSGPVVARPSVSMMMAAEP